MDTLTNSKNIVTLTPDGLRKINVTWEGFEEIAKFLLTQIKKEKHAIDVIIGNARGGLPLSVYLAHHLSITTDRYGVFVVQRHDSDKSEAEVIPPTLRGSTLPEIKGKTVLIVEDTIANEMASLSVMVEELKKLGAQKIIATAMFVGSFKKSIVPIIYYHKNSDPNQRQWVFFPWENYT